MKKTTAAILFNSMQITLSVVSDKGGFGCQEYSAKNVYSGVNKNFFVSPNEIEGLIVDLVNRYSSFSGKRIGKLNVILPQHFFRLIPSVKTVQTNGAVTETDVRSLRKKSGPSPAGYVVLDEVEGGFSVGDEGAFSSDVVGKEGRSVQMFSVAIALSGNVYELFNNISKNIRLDFTFMPPSTPLTEKLNREGKTRGLILKINQLSSDLIYYENKLAVSSILLSYGAFHFADSLAQKFSVDFETASELLSKINLGLALDEAEYMIFTSAGVKKFPVKEANGTLIELLEYWGNETRSAVDGLVEKADLPIYVVGSSVEKTHGFAEILSAKTGRVVEGVYPDFSCWNRPEEYLACALFEKF